jgi:nitrogen regulatory protein PII
MHAETRKLVTIIAEAALERRLVEDLKQLGAHGYTITDARGEGARGVRNASWEASSNIRLEVICDATLADTITAHLQAHYYAHYAMILFLSDVGVLRPEKF